MAASSERAGRECRDTGSSSATGAPTLTAVDAELDRAGGRAPGLTVAVKVTVWPKIDGLALLVSVVAVAVTVPTRNGGEMDLTVLPAYPPARSAPQHRPCCGR